MTPPLAEFDFAALRELLGTLPADAWLLYDFRGVNPAASRVLGIHGMGTRRYFVLLSRDGPPIALVHRIELSSFDGFPGEVRPYAAWRELHAQLRALVDGKTVAMEVSPRDAVPYLDRVPYGVVQLVESSGARVVSSGILVSRFAAQWSPSELAGHRRAAEELAKIAVDALHWAGAERARGVEVRETVVQRRVLEAFARAGLVTDHPPIVGFQPNSANPHYEPLPGSDRALAAGDVVLIDLWAGVTAHAVFADQTWVGVAGRDPGPTADVRRVWDAVRGARDAAVTLLRERWSHKQLVTGAALDDAARGVIQRAGFGEYFVHRTGHSIDRELHGSGPHLDNFETADERALIPGVGFSVEPGVYLPGRFGIRSEINVFVGADAPVVTPAHPQEALLFV